MGVSLLISLAVSVAISYAAAKWLPKKPIKGKRLAQDAPIMSSDEGTTFDRCYGPHVRVDSPIVLWASPRIDLRISTTEGSGKSAVKVKNWYYFKHAAICMCEGPIAQVKRIWANGKIFYDSTTPTAGAHRYDSITFYNGSTTQTPDPLIETYKGAGEVPGYRGLAYFVVNNLALADFGNMLPTFAVEVEKNADAYNVAQCIADVCTDYGLDAEYYDIIGVDGTTQGFHLSQQEDGGEALGALLTGYGLRVKERAGVLYFLQQGDEDEFELTADHIGAVSGDGYKPPITIQDKAESTKIPDEVIVDYRDTEGDLQTGSVGEQRVNKSTGQVDSFDLPISMDSIAARTVASRELWTGWSERKSAELFLMPSLLTVEETDVLVIDTAGIKRQIRVESLTRGNNYLLEAEGPVQGVFPGDSYPPTYVGVDPPGEAPDIPAQELYVIPDMLAYALDLPALSEVEATQPGFFYVHATETPGAPFLEVAYWQSALEAGDYTYLFSSNGQSTIGETDQDFDVPNDKWGWDDTNILYVTLTSGSLSSKEKSLVVAGENYALISSSAGDEIIAFRDVELIGANEYKVSGILRARRNTEFYDHPTGALFFLLSEIDLNYQAVGLGDIDNTRYLKAVPTGAEVGDITAFDFTYTGKCLETVAPRHLSGTRDGVTDAWTLVWHRIARGPHRSFSGSAPTVYEEYAAGLPQFRCRIYDGAVLKRSNLVYGEEYEYSSADQVTDFGGVQDSVKFVVDQYNFTLAKYSPYTIETVSI